LEGALAFRRAMRRIRAEIALRAFAATYVGGRARNGEGEI